MKIVIGIFCILQLVVSFSFAGSTSSDWSYKGKTGPNYWGSLSSDYATCDEGKMQSPISIVQSEIAQLNPANFQYQDTPLYILNNGHTIQLTTQPGSSIEIGEKQFQLKQVHFHSPSENKIYGRSFPMEAHFVHADENGKLLVVGLMFVIGRENQTLDSIWQTMPSMANSDILVPCKKINLADLLPYNTEYFAFQGSLTTPPCTEGVDWIVLKQPVEASMLQLRKFRTLMGGDNRRPVQPTNDRVIY